MASNLRELFISYSSHDARKVDKIAKDLSLLNFDDGKPRYKTWQDKHNLPPASPNWWNAILDAIERCNIFVFNLSYASLHSEVCRAELDYAHRCNRPIIPVVLEDEFFLVSKSGKYNLPKETWALVPDWLGETQFLFYIETVFYGQFQAAVEMFERNWPRDIPAPRPLNPDSKSVHGSNHAVYDSACDYARRLAFTDSAKHFDTLVRRNDPDYADAAAWWLHVIWTYAELIDLDDRRSAPFVFKKKWTAYVTLFPKEFLDEPIFDPKGFAVRGQATSGAVALQPAVPVTSPPVVKPARSRSIDLLPKPFAWIPIPAGKVTLVPDDTDKRESYLRNNTVFDVAAFQIAKYPLTNSQYRLFIDAGGYTQNRWWTAEGWHARKSNKWTEPQYWTDAKWNQPDYPVVGVSWFEAIAYCQWLSELTGEKIMLPTEDQWQYAAQGDDGRKFPWGNDWDGSRCNNNVDGKGPGQTSPVRQYEGNGDSPFSVVDMAGNLLDWCLTAYESGNNDINGTDVRVLRGGSWFDHSTRNFRCAFRLRGNPDYGNNNGGFRLALVLTF